MIRFVTGKPIVQWVRLPKLCSDLQLYMTVAPPASVTLPETMVSPCDSVIGRFTDVWSLGIFPQI